VVAVAKARRLAASIVGHRRGLRSVSSVTRQNPHDSLAAVRRVGWLDHRFLAPAVGRNTS
jgi:hypothetical protein